MKLLPILQNLLFPPKCILCGRLLSGEETDLCHTCRTETKVCTKPKIKIPMVAEWTAMWYYEGTVRESLLRFKFRNRRSYAEGYGPLLAMKLQQDLPDFDVLTWVPISARRKRKRGYDQVQLIADAVGPELELVPVQTLKKIRDNPPQSGIQDPAKRRANVLGAYAPADPENLAGKRVLLLDDIITTGATVSECAKVLRIAGAKDVFCAAVAASRYQR